MGYSVYWANGRHQGYGVPAYCDYPGCKEEIDRGMGYQLYEESKVSDPETFCCEKHIHEELDSFERESKDHPEWLYHVINDPTWEQWREEEPENFKEYIRLFEEHKKAGFVHDPKWEE